MRTYPIVSPETGVTFAFEVDNAYVSPSAIVRLLKEVSGVDNVKKRAPFRLTPGPVAQFTYGEQEYAVVEPFGDNSRYWIGPPEESKPFNDVRAIEARFKEHQLAFTAPFHGRYPTLKLLNVADYRFEPDYAAT